MTKKELRSIRSRIKRHPGLMAAIGRSCNLRTNTVSMFLSGKRGTRTDLEISISRLLERAEAGERFDNRRKVHG